MLCVSCSCINVGMNSGHHVPKALCKPKATAAYADCKKQQVVESSLYDPLHNPQVRQLAATALVGVDARPKPDLESLQQLALRLEQILAAHGSGIVQARAMSNTVKQAHKSLAASASGSYMYI